MEEWLVGCGAAISVVYRAFDHEAPIAVVYYSRGRARFDRTAQAHDVVTLLHEARQGVKFETG
jgi:hypothetical protein